MRLLLFILTAGFASAAPPPAWPESVIRVERRVAATDSAAICNAICIAPGVLATIADNPAASGDTWRAITATGNTPLLLLARDPDSGFCLLTPKPTEAEPNWTVITTGEKSPALPAGTSLTLQSAAPAPARVAGRDHLHDGKLLQTPWLRIHLPPGTWAMGTPVTTADGSFAGLLAAGVPGVTDAARILPAEAVWHFAGLWARRQTLARAELGIRLNHTDAIPSIQQCYDALPAQRAGIHRGDILLRIGTTEIPDATTAATACFFLRVDEPVKVTVLRGLETVETTVTPVSAQRQTAAAK